MAIDFTAAELKLAELYVIECGNGATAYFTSHDADVTYPPAGQLYQSLPIMRTPVAYHADLQVDKVTVTIGITGITVGTGMLTVPQLLRRDYLRDAHVRIYLVDYAVLDEARLLYEGWVTGDIRYDGSAVSLECGSLLDRLSERFPKMIYSENCQLQLFSTRCGKSKLSYEHDGTVQAGSTQARIKAAVFAFATHAEGYWVQGYVEFTSGDNTGVKRTVSVHDDGYATLLRPFPETVGTGNAFHVYPGCDKSGATCNTKFSNYANFLGFEYIPKPEILFG